MSDGLDSPVDGVAADRSSSSAALPQLSRGSLRRVVLSLIQTEQDRLHRKGALASDQMIGRLLAGRSADEIDRIAIGEEVLGFDSIGLLDLILAVNRFFQLNTTGIEDYLLVERQVGPWLDLIARHMAIVGDGLQHGFLTSGSAGKPKTIRQDAAVLWREMRAQRAACFEGLARPGRVISLVPPHHIYGFLFGCVLPDLSGVAALDLHRAAPTAAFRETRSGDLVVCTPFNWQMLRKTGLRFGPGVRGVTSAGPSTEETWACIETLGLAGMTEIFGSTETGGLGWREAMSAPFTLLPHLDQCDGAVTCKTTGTALPLQDALEWVSPRSFRVAGRLDKVVQVAGVNVAPALVAERISEVAGVAEAVVRPSADRLKAFVVPADSAIPPTDLDQAIRQHLRHTLAAPARPERIDYGPALPRNSMGKLCDWTEKETPAARPQENPEHAAQTLSQSRLN